MKKFTIADKQEAQSILKNNSSLTKEDKELLVSGPVFSVLVSLFEKYYGLRLISTYDASRSTYGDLKDEKIRSNYVSMVESNDKYLTKNFTIELETFSREYGTWSAGKIEIVGDKITTSRGESDYTDEYLLELEELFGKGPYTFKKLTDKRISASLYEMCGERVIIKVYDEHDEY